MLAPDLQDQLKTSEKLLGDSAAGKYQLLNRVLPKLCSNVDKYLGALDADGAQIAVEVDCRLLILARCCYVILLMTHESLIEMLSLMPGKHRLPCSENKTSSKSTVAFCGTAY
jgi:hypothetical protein